MSVKRAAQALSHTVAAGLNTHLDIGDLLAEAIYTSGIQFLQLPFTNSTS